jgi:glycosyltransferase involved in cell wall biosynthesis
MPDRARGREEQTPRISVVVPTKHRPAPTTAFIESVLAGTYKNFEVVVVDQSDDDATREAVGAFEGCAVRYYRDPRPELGAGGARNYGIVVSRGPFLAMTDDDVEAAPTWLERIVQRFEDDPGLEFIVGRLSPPNYDRSCGYVPEFDANPKLPPRRLVMRVAGANFAARRGLFERIGGYDELFGPGGRFNADDTNLFRRVQRDGARYVVDPHIEVVHTHGFRALDDARALVESYDYGNGACFGRLTRQGDLVGGATFVARAMFRLIRATISSRRLLGPIRETRVVLRGFVHGALTSPKEGFVDGRTIRELHQACKAVNNHGDPAIAPGSRTTPVVDVPTPYGSQLGQGILSLHSLLLMLVG